MNTKTKIKKSEVKEGKTKCFQIGENKIILSLFNGKYYAMENVCSHDEGELVESTSNLISECEVECPRHGARFDIRTGKATKMPAVAPVKVYKVLDLGDELEVEIEI